MAETAGQVTVRVGANIRDYQSKMQRVQNSTKKIGDRFSVLKGIVGVAAIFEPFFYSFNYFFYIIVIIFGSTQCYFITR